MKSYEVVAISDKETKVFPSLRTAAESLGIHRKNNKKRIADGKEYKGYTFDFLEEEES